MTIGGRATPIPQSIPSLVTRIVGRHNQASNQYNCDDYHYRQRSQDLETCSMGKRYAGRIAPEQA